MEYLRIAACPPTAWIIRSTKSSSQVSRSGRWPQGSIPKYALRFLDGTPSAAFSRARYPEMASPGCGRGRTGSSGMSREEAIWIRNARFRLLEEQRTYSERAPNQQAEIYSAMPEIWLGKNVQGSRFSRSALCVLHVSIRPSAVACRTRWRTSTPRREGGCQGQQLEMHADGALFQRKILAMQDR